MPGIVQFGPLVMASDRLLALALIMAFLFGLDRIALRHGLPAKTGGIALAAGLVSARLAYVLTHYDAFAQDWGAAFAFWQGGFTGWAGFLGAAAVVAWRVKSRAAALPSLGMLAAIAALWFGGSALLRPSPGPMPELPQMLDLQGKAFDPGQLAGRPYVVNLWATWCPPCRRELPMLAQEAGRAGVPILLVSQGEDARIVRTFLEREGIAGSAVLLDRASGLSRALGSTALPTTLFVDRQGRIVETQIGELSRAALADGIASIEE
ncbi:MAG TPA: prolipoprotein diacylglyceryl transferase family protein [Sphingomonadaceae bacterium]|nr:prolipoprotein diacylglyceryl transferase family protein [Sphingomonadaceae bacterium]